MNQIRGKDIIDYADMLQIIFGEKCITRVLGDERSLNYTFDEMLEDAKKNGFIDVENNGTILVVAESPLAGTVYRYGNYGNYWVKIGTTEGYA